MTAQVYCAVLLCLSGCWSSTEAALGQNTGEKIYVKQGECPNTKYEAEVCARIRFVSCADDRDCDKREKCCNNGCGRQCMAPDTVKPGVCPNTNFEEIRCFMKGKELCADDSECPNKEKCCSTACGGRQCTAPVTVKPGVCPSRKYKPGQCARVRFVSCADDSDCANNEKCCSNGCGLQCMAPVTANPGVCPSRKYKPGQCARIRFAPCADDSDCANNEKCCNNGCGLQCMAPVTAVKPGVCPSTNHEAAMCFMMGLALCADDSDCANKEKCCGTACGGRQCVAPVTEKPGVCPITNHKAAKCLMMGLALCADDSDCANNEKCCSTACGGRQCVAPVTAKPGVCPIISNAEVLCLRKGEVPLCADDSECPRKEKCCSTVCGGRQCTAPVTANPGVCPSTKYKPGMCAWIRFLSCADDRDCANNEKCCSNGCGLQCMAPVTVKPGVCPNTKYEARKCARIRFVSCADDSDCAKKNEKCCNNGCGLQCMAPVTVKPGVCPRRKYKPGQCPLISFVSCADDSDCAKNEKCCSNGCGLQCTAPGYMPY
ncbi:hypothetical protein PO909_013699 [Leuciscus waleckii]